MISGSGSGSSSRQEERVMQVAMQGNLLCIAGVRMLRAAAAAGRAAELAAGLRTLLVAQQTAATAGLANVICMASSRLRRGTFRHPEMGQQQEMQGWAARRCVLCRQYHAWRAVT